MRLMLGLTMNVYKEYYEYIAIIYIIIIFTVVPCAAWDNINLMSYETNTPMSIISNNLTKTNDLPSSLSTNDSYFTGYFTGARHLFGYLDKKYNLSPVTVEECLVDKTAITIGKYGDKITWRFVPLFDASGYNPIDAIKNFELMCQFRF
jgi:hypothetical protein